MAQASERLAQLEQGQTHPPQGELFSNAHNKAPQPVPPSAEAEALQLLCERISALDPDQMTPREALDALYQLQSQLPKP
jgi:DNA mismatch repair protein MutS